MEENFSMEWNMEWKIFSMEWKWNGRKSPAWNMEKSSPIPFYTMLIPFHRGLILISLSFVCLSMPDLNKKHST